MNANNARLQSEKVYMEKLSAQYKRIMEAVEFCISLGETHCMYVGDLEPGVLKKLKLEGYKVESGRRPVDSEDDNKISW